MGYVASRKFCCCLPVRFGVFCMAFLGLGVGVGLSALGWYEVHQYSIGQVAFDKREIVALYFITIAYTILGFISIIGLIGSIFKVRPLVIIYAYSVTFHTLVNIGIGIFFVWALFHRDDGLIDNCKDALLKDDNNTNDNVEKVTHWFCQKGFGVVRVLLVIAFCIIWIFQIAGIFIVFDYVGQLREEKVLKEDEKEKKEMRKAMKSKPQPAIPSEPPMRTTYDSNPGWTSAKSPYAFSVPENAHGSRYGSGRV